MTESPTTTKEPVGPPADLIAAIAADPPAPSDLVVELRRQCEALRDEEAEVARLQHVLAEAKARVLKLKSETIIDTMDRCGVGALDLLPRGNYPAARVEVKPYVGANIAAGWPEEQRRAGFDWLDNNEAGDLIKTTLVLRMPREKRSQALEIAKKLKELKLGDVEVLESVHNQTLSAWLRERLRKGIATPLDVIGGYAGRIAQIKPR